jgi:hypothetical protein
MRVLVAIICFALSLGGCSRPPQVVYVKPLPDKWPSQPRSSPPEFKKARLARSQPVTSRKETTPVKQNHPISQAPASEKSVPPLPPKMPEQRHAVAVDSSSSKAEPHLNAKFALAKEKARREGVESLTSKDIDGLSLEQIKELRGY